MLPRRFRLPAAAIAGIVLALGTIAATSILASAHVVDHFGTFQIAIGWLHEPTYIGAENAVQVIVKDAQGNAVGDLASGDLKVEVSVGSQKSSALNLQPAFDADTGLGTPGDYHASIIPTAVGDYTFHLTGSIKGTAVDKSYTSSDKTFNSVTDSSQVQFPNKQPTTGDVSTKLDRVAQRVDIVTTSAQSAADSARSAADSANRATVLAIIGIVLAILLGALNLVVGRRRRV